MLPEREGVAAKINKFLNKLVFIFLFFPFCRNNNYVPEMPET